MVLALTAALLLPNLALYPWAAPDEIHHLIVAKNLAEYGKYASGAPEQGFRVFDPFDSVGAPVIAPVALVFKSFGTGLTPARAVVALHFLAQCLAVYFLVRDTYGAGAGVMAAACVTAAFSSIYLGRTLYGEVPGFFYFTFALACWRKCLNKPAFHWSGPAAGIAFGLAVLCKTILLLCVVPCAVVVLHDRLTFRMIRLRHVLWPAAGTAGALLTWTAIQSFSTATWAEPASGTLGLYRHYLLIGLRAAWRNAPYLLRHPYAHLVIFGCTAAAAMDLVRKRYDPALLLFVLTGGLFAFWWMFYTPGQHPRYLWYSYVVSGACVGIAAARLGTQVAAMALPVRRRVFAGALVAVILGPSALWVARQAGEVWTNREMAADTALAAYVRQLPEGTRIATTFYPLRGTLSFLADRSVALVEAGPGSHEGYEVLIEKATPRNEPLELSRGCREIGPYIVRHLGTEGPGNRE